MLEKPDIADSKIAACLRDAYGLPISRLDFLPIGADLNTAVYRASAQDEATYFVKLRTGIFDGPAVTLPKYLHDQGIEHLIIPLPARDGGLWADLDAWKLILYPFVEGHDSYQAGLSDRQWSDFGTALKRIHTLDLPPAIKASFQRENYSPQWRETLKRFLAGAGKNPSVDPVASQLTGILQARGEQIDGLIARAETLARIFQAHAPEFVLCHTDIHAGNLLIGTGETFYIVDWDNPLLAAKERDLMYIGGGLMGGWRSPQKEEIPFYEGYGPAQVDPVGLAYYRYERIVQDLAIYCEQLLLTAEGGDDRAQSLAYFLSNFSPGGTIEQACRADKTIPIDLRNTFHS